VNLLLDARRIMFYDLVDDAALLTPASGSLQLAASAFRATRAGPAGWITGRFLCPTSRLEELAGLLTGTMAPEEPPWRVGATFDEPLGTAALHVSVFDRYIDPAGSVPIAEVPPPPDDFAARVVAAQGASPQLVPFVPIGDSDVAALAALAKVRLRPIGALLGGGEPVTTAAAHIAACVATRVPFRVAGVNHAVRSEERHGVMNLLTATALSHSGVDAAELRTVLAEQDSAAFTVTAVGLRWRDHLIAARQLRAARTSLVAVSSANDHVIAALNASSPEDGAARRRAR
jgi:hypothetical protein